MSLVSRFLSIAWSTAWPMDLETLRVSTPRPMDLETFRLSTPWSMHLETLRVSTPWSIDLDTLRLSTPWPWGLAVAGVLVLVALWIERRAGSPWRHAILRTVIVALLTAATMRPYLEFGALSPIVILADRSSSVEAGAVDGALLELGVPRDGVAVLDFGDEHASPLARAIDTGFRALPDGGRLVILSDGRATDADPERIAAQASSRGVAVDVLPLPSHDVVDAAVVALDAPTSHRFGDPVPVAIQIRASGQTSGTLTVSVNDQDVRSVPLSLSDTVAALVHRTVLVGSPGSLAITARIDVPGDMRHGNDSATAIVLAAAPLEVLVVGEAEGAVRLADQLESVGARATVAGPQRVPGRISELAAWDVIVLADVPARDLGVDQLAGIEAFVADLGRGLVMTGGRQAYLAGAWQSTALERLAPVDLEPTPRGTRDPVALVFMIDQSASMGTADGRTGVSKLDLAREAAALSAEVLHAGDTVGIVTYDDAARWLVPLTTTGTGREMADLQSALGGLTTGGGTRIREAIELGLPALTRLGDADVDALRRHAVLISDGRDFHDDGTRIESAVRSARASGVTLSTIAIGFDADRPMLEQLARMGRGRFLSADDPSDLPRIAVEESEVARADAERRGAFQPIPAGAGDHPALLGIDVGSLPMLGGYVSVSPRRGAATVLETPAGDVLMATWQYGLGRVTAWTSDVGEAWATEWTESSEAGAFWRRMLGYVAREAALGPPGVTVETVDGVAHVVVDTVGDDGRTVDLVRVQALDNDRPSGTATDLVQTAPGMYAGAVAPVSDVGSLTVRVEDEDEPIEVPAAWSRRLTGELVPGLRDRLPGIVAASSGRVLEPADIEALRAQTQREQVPLWGVLVALAAVLWLVDVARQTGTPEVRWRVDRLRSIQRRMDTQEEESK